MSVPSENQGLDLTERGAEFEQFWTERRLASLSTIRPNGTPHVTPVGVTVDFATGIARVICSDSSAKARYVLAASPARVAVCAFDGRAWSTLEGSAQVRRDSVAVADAEARYARRYRVPRPNPHRVVIEIVIDRVLGNQ